MEKMHIKLNVNGKDVDLLTEPRTLLIHALREELGITGPHLSLIHISEPTRPC